MSSRLFSRRVAVVLAALLGVVGAVVPDAAPRAMLTAEQARTRAAALKNEGVTAYQEGRLAEAVAALAAAIDINLNDFFAHYYLGLAYRDSARYAEARAVLEVAAELDPRYLRVYVALGDVALGQGDPGTARAWFQRALNRQAGYAPALDGLGRLDEAVGDIDDAIGHYRDAIEANRGFPRPYVHLGAIYRRQGRQSEALDLFEQAIKYRPDFAPAYRYLGSTYGDLGRRNEATTFLEEALRLEPENVDTHLEMAHFLLQWDDPHRAREHLETAARLAPHRDEPLVERARLERIEERYDEALAALDAALALDGLSDSRRLEILNVRVNYEREQKQVAALRAEVDDVDDDNGDSDDLEDAVARLGLARVHRDAGDHDDAFRECARALEPLGRPAEVVFECGYYALEARDFGPAADLLEETTRRDPSSERAFIDLGLAYRGLGRLNSAAGAYRQALELNPRSIEALVYLGNAQFELGDIEDADRHYRGALALVSDTRLLDRLQAVLQHIEERRLDAVAPVMEPGEAPAASSP